MSFAPLLPLLVVQLPAGVLVDRWDRRRLMVICEGARAVALGSVVDRLAAGRFSAVQLAAVAFLETSLAILYRLAERGAVRTLRSVRRVGIHHRRLQCRRRTTLDALQGGSRARRTASPPEPMCWASCSGV
ncbi:hypothetical protein [Streptomyces griseoviridis]|uniref:hypothetical protein n=1 Tax=Streptomyces griseoviridis TaxID=45398 RepID=UPI00341833AD